MHLKSEMYLVAWVIALMDDEGFDALHVTELMPTRKPVNSDKWWSPFIKLSISQNEALSFHNIKYDQSSGWFRRV